MTFFIAVEWTSARLSAILCSTEMAAVKILDKCFASGVLQTRDFEAELSNALMPWLKQYPGTPVILSGMIGSNLGWIETGYAPCPSKATDLRDLSISIKALGTELIFSPGLDCISPFGTPDLMRSEEAYVFGALSELGLNAGESAFLCIAGKHPKWVQTDGQTIRSFFTSVQGDLALAFEKDTLVGKAIEGPRDISTWKARAEFDRGARLIIDNPTLGISQALFSVRSLVVKNLLQADCAGAYGQGLLVASDIRDSLNVLSANVRSFPSLNIIGSTDYVLAYEHVCKLAGIPCTVFGDSSLFVKGLSQLHQSSQHFQTNKLY